MWSTSSKIAFGYLILIGLLFGAVSYIYEQMSLLVMPSDLENTIGHRRRTTHLIVTKLYKAEVIGQTLRIGKLDEYPRYLRAMKEAGASIDSLRTLLTDTLQQKRLDTVRVLLRNKEQNMKLVLEAMKQSPTEELYKQQIDSLIMKQDSLINGTHVQRKIITHHNSYTIRHKPKKFFKRLADVFSPGKEDSTLVNNVVQEEYTDTIDETYSPADTLVVMLTNIQHKVFQTKQENQKTLDNRIYRLRTAGGKLGQRVNQLLESIEKEEQKAAELKFAHEQNIRKDAAWAMGTISLLAVVLSLIFFAIIWRDLTRSNHYRRELEKAKLYAENLLVAREKLMLTITHDIKAPAGSIIGYIELLTRLIKDKRQVFYLENMKCSASHLLDLVTSLLDYHRLEAGKMDLNPVAFRPNELLRNIYMSFRPLAEKKGLSLRLENELKQNLTLEGDPLKIRQIVENLLSNALKFTSQGEVVLGMGYQGNRFCFKVKDSGCGMTEEEKEKVFQAFTRLRSAQGQEGFGLGLSITQKLVELLQGNIDIESTLGEGTTFTVWMPLPSIANPQKINIESKKEETAAMSLKVIMIDDDRIQLNLTEAMIRNLTEQGDGETVIRCCEQPEELFEWLVKEDYDLLLTDIQMPALNGFELLKKVHHIEQETGKHLPVIAITARMDMTEEDFREKGFAGCLHKPFNQNDLRKIFHQTITGEWNTAPNNETEQTVQETLHTDKHPEHKTFNFKTLIAFSEDDLEAAGEIMQTFIQETEKSLQRMKEALEKKDIKEMGNIAHKMIPTFIMIEASEAVTELRELEQKREAEEATEDDLHKADNILLWTGKIIEAARIFGKELKKDSSPTED